MGGDQTAPKKKSSLIVNGGRPRSRTNDSPREEDPKIRRSLARAEDREHRPDVVDIFFFGGMDSLHLSGLKGNRSPFKAAHGSCAYRRGHSRR